jgi:two-component system, chemotaxis family, sensor kinase CheA
MKRSKKRGMNPKRERWIQAIGKIRQDIDSVTLSDQKAWKTIGIELEALAQNFPQNLSVPLKTLNLCTQAVQILAEETKVHSFALIETLSDALDAAENYLSGKPDKKPAIQKATQQLKKALAKEQGAAAENRNTETGRPADPPVASLDDAAALVIQLEPDDLPGLAELKELLQRLAADEAYCGFCREYVSEAAKQIEGIIEAPSGDAQTVLKNAGELLEKAMNVIWETGAEADAQPPEGRAAGRDSRIERSSDSCSSQNVMKETLESEDSIAAKSDLMNAEGSEPDSMPENADPDLLAEFITESTDLISSAEEALLTLETDPQDMDAVNTVFRAFHTIKGTAAFMDLALICEMGHHAESLLSRVREGEILYGGGYADLSLRALDMLKELIVSVQGALQGSPLSKPAGYADLMELLANPEGAGISNEIDQEPPPRLGDVLVAQGKIGRNKVEQAAQSHPHQMIGAALVKDKLASVTDVGRALRTQKRMQSSGQIVESSVRVSTERLDRLIDMVGELVIAHSMVAQDHLLIDGNHHALVKKISHTSKIVRELQDISMSMRMVPLKATFNKMARLVRDLARKINKKVHFITEGEDTEIDRNLVNIVNDPLVHMVRNAVDHGIETPEIRTQLGKAEYGTVTLSAYHAAGNVVVEIKDDGQGLDREIIVAKACEKGLIDEGRSLSDREVFNLIFEPGFSTANSVTDISGRGVGMDVVKKNIESLRGLVEIRSEAGKGSVFKVILPLTMAIIDGMVVRVGSETYVIPTVSIVRSIKPEPGDISTVHNRGEMFSLQGSLIPLFRLSGLFRIGGPAQEQNQALVVVVEDEEHRAGLLIDELIGRQQVVIKTLGEALRDIPGISGGAILPNGRVGLILDVGGLVRFATAGHSQDPKQQAYGAKDKVLAA